MALKFNMITKQRQVNDHKVFHYNLFFNKLILFIYFWLHWVFIAVRRLSLVAVNRGYSLLRCTGFLLQQLLLLPTEHRL